jgi:hypothetical protein
MLNRLPDPIAASVGAALLGAAIETIVRTVLLARTYHIARPDGLLVFALALAIVGSWCIGRLVRVRSGQRRASSGMSSLALPILSGAVGVLAAFACVSVLSADPMFASPFQVRDLHLRLIVRGHVVDASNAPVPNATVQVRLGLDLDGTAVTTDQNGYFQAEARSGYWFKGDPSVTVQARGFRESWSYLHRWLEGPRAFTVVIRLMAEPSSAQQRSSSVVRAGAA